MDELFQKASENYPLKTTAGNFDELMPFLAGPAAVSSSAKPAALKRQHTAMLLVLLLSGVSTITYLKYNPSNKQKTKEVVTEQANKTQAGNTTLLSNTQITGNLSAALNSLNTVILQHPLVESDNIFSPGKIKGNTPAQIKVNIKGTAADDMNDNRQTNMAGLSPVRSN